MAHLRCSNCKENTIDCHVKFFGIFISSATITVEPFLWIFSYSLSVPAETFNVVLPLYKCGSGKVLYRKIYI